MTLVQLKYFLSLAETLNFSAVAREFYVAQTSVSYSIQSLEQELGVKLFVRTTKSTSLTPAGHLFYDRARVAVELLERAQGEAVASMETSTVMIGCSRLCAGKHFYDTIHTLQEENPGIQLLLTSSEPEVDLFGELDSGKVDIAVYLKTPFEQTQPLQKYVTKEFPINAPRRIIVSVDHPFARHKEGLPPECMKSVRRITYGNLEDILLHTPSAGEVTERAYTPLLAKDVQSLLDMVGANLGIGCLPLLGDLQTESVCSIPILEDKAPESFLTLAISYHQDNASPSVVRIAEQLARVYLNDRL